MPNPVPLATKEEEDRRAWVTAHHEVVRLVKDCFGDRFSNNEIFDRLKISRRTGYRALGNDERIGKAPGRKPKITEATIREMIDYIERGGCADVGNVWKHLAERFAPDCNPKTVQDAVKKSGFKNYRDTVKLEPFLAVQLTDGQNGNDQANGNVLVGVDDIDDRQLQQLQQATSEKKDDLIAGHDPQDDELHIDTSAQQHQSHGHQQHTEQHEDQDDNIDPSFHSHQTNISEALKQAISAAPDAMIRYAMIDICHRFPEAAQLASTYLVFVPSQPEVADPQHAVEHLTQQISGPSSPQIHPALQIHRTSSSDTTALDVGLVDVGSSGKRSRIAMCRRCGRSYDRAENTMDNRSCLYHKGSRQRISPETLGSMDQRPEAFIWSCCGGNGNVRGCCRAMHTTKKKRSYGKKRDAATAGFEDVIADQDQQEHYHHHHHHRQRSIGSGLENLDHSDLNLDTTDVGLDDSAILSVANVVQMQNQQSQSRDSYAIMRLSHGHTEHNQQDNSVHDPNIDSSLEDLRLPTAAVQQMRSQSRSQALSPVKSVLDTDNAEAIDTLQLQGSSDRADVGLNLGVDVTDIINEDVNPNVSPPPATPGHLNNDGDDHDLLHGNEDFKVD